MRIERRELLRVAGSTAAIGLAGCSAFSKSRPKLDVTVKNARNETVDPLIQVIRPDSADRSEGIVYETEPEIPPQSAGDDEWGVTDVAPAKKYRIEVSLRRGTYHYHYLPDCLQPDEHTPFEPRVHLIILDEENGVLFRQTHCNEDHAGAP